MISTWSKNGKIKSVGIIFAFAIVVIIVYWPAMRASFVYDDAFFIEKNTAIRSVSNALRFLTDRTTTSSDASFHTGIYRPLQMFTFSLNYAVGGLNPLGYHLINILLHIANAVVLYYLVLALCKDRFIAIVSALLFALHPVQTEAVTWASSRASVLFLFFYLISFLSYIKKNYILCYLAFCLAVLSKEMAITLPATLLFYDIFFERKDESIVAWVKKKTWTYCTFAAIVLGYLALRIAVIGYISQYSHPEGGIYGAFLMSLRAFGFYFHRLLVPIGLSVKHLAIEFSPLTEMSVVVPTLCIVGLLLISWKTYEKTRIVSFCLAWFFISMIPVTYIIFPLPGVVAERFLYLPMIGFSITLAFLMGKMHSRSLSIGILLVLLSFYSYQAYARNTEWKNSITFWTNEVELNPESSKAHGGLAAGLLNARRYIEAENELKRAIDIEPGYSDAYVGLGDISFSRQKYEEAGKYYQSALDFKDGHSYANALNGLGNINFVLGSLDLAQKHYEQVVAEYPGQNQIDSYMNLGNVYGAQKKFKEAERIYAEVIAMDPKMPEAYFNLSYIYFLQGDKTRALETLQLGLQRTSESELSTSDREKLENLKKLIY